MLGHQWATGWPPDARLETHPPAARPPEHEPEGLPFARLGLVPRAFALQQPPRIGGGHSSDEGDNLGAGKTWQERALSDRRVREGTRSGGLEA